MKTGAKSVLHKIHNLVEFEENVGKLWHRLVTSSASKHYPQEKVLLKDVSKRIGIFFRALGGDGGMKVGVSAATENFSQRNWLQRLAGTEQKVELGWRDVDALYLPSSIDLFPSKKLNQSLYFWLAALASMAEHESEKNDHWIEKNQRACLKVLQKYPGLHKSYETLVQAQLQIRPNEKSLRPEQWQQELLIRQALLKPGSVELSLQQKQRTVENLPAVYLWLQAVRPSIAAVQAAQDDATEQAADGEVVVPEEQRHYKAEQVEMPDGDNGLVLDRFENIFSWAEYIKVDRTTDENDDLSSAEETANDLDQLSVARDNKATAKRIRFDLDLPSFEEDDEPLGEGILLPEWDYRKQQMIEDHCCLQPMIAVNAQPLELPSHLRASARHIRQQFEALLPQRVWHRGQPEGSELDLNAYVDFKVAHMQGQPANDLGLFKDFRGGLRDLDCLLLADLSLSTDAAVSEKARVIDVIRDSLMLFSEALSATGDGLAMYGFSSRYRQHVRLHSLKTFNDPYNGSTRRRIAAIKPGFYTRIGAAIRHATDILEKRKASQRILLLLTDGKPNDLDLYEGRYGVEDTRMAIIEARQKGLMPFCVTIDPQAGSYLPYMFGHRGYVQIKKPQELPKKLPLLYAKLTSN